MKKQYHLAILLIFFAIIFQSCSNQDDNYVPVSPVVMDLSQVPYPKLSDYAFFEGDLKDQKPAYKVIPYKPASELFSNYAHKKRFVWMPNGSSASFDGAENVLDFPIGAVLIKTFYYDNVLPSNTTKIIETRLLIRKSDGWKAYDYIWNEEQTEALLDTDENGVFIPITFIENNVTKSLEYKIPSQTECVTCHKINPQQTGEITIPIGPKPQNLNTEYNYGTSVRNQLQKWTSEGYIDNTLPALASIKSTVDWKDTSKSLEDRARSYVDINCAHCHRDGGHCDYVAQRFDYSNNNLNLFGVCLPPLFQIPDNPYIINSGDADHSEIIYRMNTNEGSEMMPIIGRSVVHEEGVQLMRDWINSMQTPCE